VLAALRQGRLLGTNFVTRWGKVGYFGPLSVHPELQEGGIAKALVAATMQQFDAWAVTHAGLFTFAQSAKHLALYQKFGFHARYLTAIMARPARPQPEARWQRYSALSDTGRQAVLRAAKEVTNSLYPGFDLCDEIATTQALGLGDTVLVEGSNGLAGFAVCLYGSHSEAGADTCFVKCGAVRDTPSAEQDFLRLLDGCEALAASVGMGKLLLGMNLARHEAYRHLVARGFRTEIQGVAMHRDNEPGYCRPGLFVIDDWR